MGEVKIIQVVTCQDCPLSELRSVSMVGSVEDAGRYCGHKDGNFKLKILEYPETIDTRCPLPDMPL